MDDLLLVIVDRKRAYTTWDLESCDSCGPLVSDCYFLRDAKPAADGLAMAVECLPGTARLATCLSRAPRSVQVDGSSVPFRWDNQTAMLSFEVATPALPDVAIQF